MAIPDYPWYAGVSGDDLEQGDILTNCQVFVPVVPFKPVSPGSPARRAEVTWQERDVLIMSQTCDLVKGREKLTEVLLCLLWRQSELRDGFLSTAKGMEEARRGNVPGAHVLNACRVPGIEEPEYRVVDFRRVHSLPLALVRQFAAEHSPRARRSRPGFRTLLHAGRAPGRYSVLPLSSGGSR